MKTVIEMAREAGAVFPADGSYHKFEFEGSLEAFAELVRADEREACAKVCEERLGPTATAFYGKTYAAAIRARSNT